MPFFAALLPERRPPAQLPAHPKTFATWATEASESLWTRITSSRNSLGNAFGMVYILPTPTHIDAEQMSLIRAADPHLDSVDFPCTWIVGVNSSNYRSFIGFAVLDVHKVQKTADGYVSLVPLGPQFGFGAEGGVP
jgi:hypothetical protein